MTIKKLTILDKQSIFHLFNNKKNYMGTDISEHTNAWNDVIEQKRELFARFTHDMFSNTYLTDLKSYHAYGKFDENDNITCLIAFYVSQDDASWYWTHIKNSGDITAIRECLDHIIEYNESNGYYKFYSMFPKKYEKLYRRLAFSEKNAERYGAVDEYYVKQKEQCKFNLAWQILYNRRLLPVDTTVRLTYLKPEYRNSINGGNL